MLLHLLKPLLFLSLGLYYPGTCISAATTSQWTKNQLKLYAQRRFIDLELNLIASDKSKLAFQMVKLSQDLEGCKYLHEGKGQLTSFEKCFRFMKAEKQLNLLSPGRKAALAELNLLCVRFSERYGFAQQWFANENLQFKDEEWKPCSDALWRQVFLTSKANFQSSPVNTLALIRKAKSNLLPNKHWQSKIDRVLTP